MRYAIDVSGTFFCQGSTMVTYVWGNIKIGFVIAACFVGPVSDAYSPTVSNLSPKSSSTQNPKPKPYTSPSPKPYTSLSPKP
jgi:hypothetical protein